MRRHLARIGQDSADYLDDEIEEPIQIPHEEDDLKRRHKELSPFELDLLVRSQVPPTLADVLKFVNKLIIRKQPAYEETITLGGC